MCEHVEGGGFGIADVAGSDRREEDVIDSTDGEIFQCLVGVDILFEGFLGFVVCSADGGYLRGRCSGGGYRGGTRIGRSNEGSG